MAEDNPVKPKSRFAGPTTDVEAERFKQAREVIRAAFDELLLQATAAGWGIQEIAVAMVDAAGDLKESHVADASPVEVPPAIRS